MKSRIVVAAIIKKHNLILLGHKPPDVGPYPNTWYIPGGGVNMGTETLEEAVRREIREECSIEVRNLKRLSFHEDFEPDKHGIMTHYLFLVYEAVYESGEIKAADDLYMLKWFTLEELRDIQLTRPSVNLFRHLGLIP